MIQFNTKIHFDTAKLKKKQQMARQKAQMQLDQDILKDSNYFIPKETGELERSSLRHSRIGRGILIWMTKYARRLYYNPEYDFSKDVNPNASGLWFEMAKAVNKKNWLKESKKNYARFFNGK